MKYLEYLFTGNVKYCIVHGWQSLPEYLPSDLDIVVSRQQLNALERSLSSKGRIVQLLQHETSCFYFVLAIWEGDKIYFIPLDAATDYRRNGRVFFAADELLKGRRRWNRLWVASPSVEFTYLLAKKVLKGAMPPQQKTRLQELYKALGEDARAIVWRFFGARWGEQVISWIAQSDWAPFGAHLPTLKHVLRWRVMKRDPLNPLRYWIPELGRIWQRWRYPTGLFVAVLGPDGVGKSTLVSHLRKAFAGAFRGTEVFHLRPDVIGQRLTNGPVTDPHGKNPRSWWLSLFKISYYLLDYSLGYLFKVRPRLVRSTLVLFDRYYDDLLVDPRRYRYGGSQWLVRIVQRFISRPDLFLVLDVPEEQLLARKREVSREELHRQREGYRQLSAKLLNAVLLDGSLAAEEVARNASEVIINYLNERYLKHRHLWFRDDGSKTLNWLATVLGSSSKKVRFALSSAAKGDTDTRWQIAEEFGWLALKDGRGYLIPVKPGKAGAEALELYNAQNLTAVVAKGLLTAGLKSGVIQPLLRKAKVLVRQNISKTEIHDVLLLEYLKRVLGRRDLTFGISLGTPGPHRKPVIQVLTHKAEALGYVKVGWNDTTNALVQNEAEILQHLEAVSIQSFIVPRVFYAGRWNGRFLCVQSGPEGRVKPAPRTMTPRYLAVLQEFAALHTQQISLQESTFWKKFQERIEKVSSPYYRHVLQRGISKLEEWLSDEKLPFHLRHGDLAPWNAKLVDRQLFLFDWEYADPEAPPAWDLFHFLVQTTWLLKRQSLDRIYKVFGKDGRMHNLVAEYFVRVGLKVDALGPLYLLYLLDRLVFHVLEDSANFQTLGHLVMIVNLAINDEISW